LALILASSSAIRRQMLDSARVEYRAFPPNVDENALKAQLDTPEEIAAALAEEKARHVSAADSDDWVAGSDSVVSVGTVQFDKARSREEAANHLRFFSGKALKLTSAVALARGGAVDWRHVESAILQVRPLSEQFIQDYLDGEWPEVGHCVGVFRLEGRGVQLFSSIDGNYFTILGMPLIPLLGALRERGLLQS
jgi:septum formation protein